MNNENKNLLLGFTAYSLMYFFLIMIQQSIGLCLSMTRKRKKVLEVHARFFFLHRIGNLLFNLRTICLLDPNTIFLYRFFLQRKRLFFIILLDILGGSMTNAPRTDAPAKVAPQRHLLPKPRSSSDQNKNSTSASFPPSPSSSPCDGL